MSGGITATFRGHLGRDAELRYTGNGTAMLTFSVAVRDDRAAPDAPAQWVRVALFGDRAEELAGTLSKGDEVEASGRLVVKLYQGRPDLELYAWDVQPVLGRPRGRRRAPRGEPIALGTGHRVGRVRRPA